MIAPESAWEHREDVFLDLHVKAVEYFLFVASVALLSGLAAFCGFFERGDITPRDAARQKLFLFVSVSLCHCRI